MSEFPAFFLVKPVDLKFQITSRFGDPRDYSFALHREQKHEGLDLAAVDAQGRPVAVFAAQRGVVNLVAFTDKGYGNYVRIKHEWGPDIYVTWYGHLSAITVKEGQFVQAGQKIGIAGSTGFSFGVHLHLTLQHLGHGKQNYVVDDVVDPEPFFDLDVGLAFDEAKFLADVTVPDNTVFKPGERFNKTWRVRNVGTKAWDGGYQLAFAGHEQMGAPDAVALPSVPVQPGQTANLTVPLTAPTTSGTHRSTWMLRNRAGDLFPQELFTVINVEDVSAFDQAQFVADVTVMDGTVFQAGDTFVKTWRLRNSGATTWTTDYTLRHTANERMNGPDEVCLSQPVAPGETVEISVLLTAPNKQGRHRSTWQLHNASGEPFNFALFAEIQVPQVVAEVDEPGDIDPGGETPIITGLSQMQFVADVTIPDEMEVQPGATFVKTWRIRNAGETTWGDGFDLVFFGDNQMGGPESVPLPPADSGEKVEISVILTAPAEPGTYRSTWKGRDPQGNTFEFDLFALIMVPDVQQPAAGFDEMNFGADVTVPDGTLVLPGEQFVKTWRVRNTGTTTWQSGYSLAFWGDAQMNGPESVSLPPVAPGESAEVSVMLTAPQTMGLHKSTWKARNAQGQFFDFEMFTVIEVTDPDQTVDMLAYMRGDGRVYDLEFDWAGGGRQRVQTQVEGHRFYHVKWNEWEELWADDQHVYRGTDTSSGGGEVYTLTENGQYGSAWVPRRMTIGVPFRRTPTVVFRNKETGAVIPEKQGQHTTWTVLEAVHAPFVLPNGVKVKDAAVLAAYADVGGAPAAQPFERYYYARKFGLVGWEGSIGQSMLIEKFKKGTMPDNEREVIAWIDRIRPD